MYLLLTSRSIFQEGTKAIDIFKIIIHIFFIIKLLFKFYIFNSKNTVTENSFLANLNTIDLIQA